MVSILTPSPQGLCNIGKPTGQAGVGRAAIPASAALWGPGRWVAQRRLCSLPARGFCPCQQQHIQGKLPLFGTALVQAQVGSLCLTLNHFDIAAGHHLGMESRLKTLAMMDPLP